MGTDLTHNVSINGKSGKTTYNIGWYYLHQNGMMKPAKKDDFTRYNASVRLSTEINKYLTIRAGSIFSSRDKRYPYSTSSTTADPWLYLYRCPNMPLVSMKTETTCAVRGLKQNKPIQLHK